MLCSFPAEWRKLTSGRCNLSGHGRDRATDREHHFPLPLVHLLFGAGDIYDQLVCWVMCRYYKFTSNCLRHAKLIWLITPTLYGSITVLTIVFPLKLSHRRTRSNSLRNILLCCDIWSTSCAYLPNHLNVSSIEPLKSRDFSCLLWAIFRVNIFWNNIIWNNCKFLIPLLQEGIIGSWSLFRTIQECIAGGKGDSHV